MLLFRGFPQYVRSAEIVPVMGLRPPILILFCSSFAFIRSFELGSGDSEALCRKGFSIRLEYTK